MNKKTCEYENNHRCLGCQDSSVRTLDRTIRSTFKHISAFTQVCWAMHRWITKNIASKLPYSTKSYSVGLDNVLNRISYSINSLLPDASHVKCAKASARSQSSIWGPFESIKLSKQIKECTFVEWREGFTGSTIDSAWISCISNVRFVLDGVQTGNHVVSLT